MNCNIIEVCAGCELDTSDPWKGAPRLGNSDGHGLSQSLFGSYCPTLLVYFTDTILCYQL